MVAVNVHDIPTERDCFKQVEKPLCYTASLPLKDVKKRFCNQEVLPKVCAVLSWGIPIPAGNFIHQPIWGDKLTCQIQLNPLFLIQPPIFNDLQQDIFIPKFLEIAESNPNLTVSQITALSNEEVDQAKTLSDYKPQVLNVSEIAKLYKVKGKFSVTPLRFTMPTLAQLKVNPQNLQITNDTFKQIGGLNLADLLTQFEKVKANTNFEQLESLGLDYNRNRLSATFRIKRPSGYSGTLCQKGSQEHIAFWADWNDDCKFTYLGTASVNVHDLQKIAKKGTCYTAYLPVNMDKFRQQCSAPKIVRIRAVLSWNTLPSTTDPNDLNTYGNRMDTHIQLKPREYLPGLYPFFSILGGIPISEVNSSTGLTLLNASFALNGLPPHPSGKPSPFAKRVTVQGPLHPGRRYRIQVRQVGTLIWDTVTTPYRVVNNAGIPDYHHPGADGYFNYLPDSENNNNLLAWWNTSGDEKWEVKIDIQGIPGDYRHFIQLNHTRPSAEINISDNGVAGQGNCKDYAPGETLEGTVTGLSPTGYDGHYALSTNVPGGTFTPSSSGSIPISPNTWKMKIPAGTTRCGYFVKVFVEDLTIINSSSAGWTRSDNTGFCVR